MIKTTITEIEKKNMSAQSMKSLAKCCVEIAIEKIGQQIAADALIHRASKRFPHLHLHRDIMIVAMNADKLAYIMVGLQLLLDDNGYEASIDDIFKKCKDSYTPKGGKRLIDEDERAVENKKPWKPFKA